MTKPNLILFAAAGLAIAGPCKPGSSIAQTSEVSVSYSVTRSSVANVATSTVETLSALITDTTKLTNEETTTLSSTQIASDTTLDTMFFYTETATAETTTGLPTELLADTTLATIAVSLSSSETLSGLAATTSATADEPYECVGSIRIQHDYYRAIRGGYLGPQTWNDCAQLCEEDLSCYAFSHNSANSCWNAAAGDVVAQAEGQGWTSGVKGTCPQD
ncbi:uncharacterized protein FTOL_06919 [Fusarium torulosum]|uniref:Apple domain-containing protein n=1 Tax=Fusarium torulosum TaxID=33205 RepID=A0AAE8MB22_9HYPO|nr:uncharacterized protein FTOL_06919 [Fusarium torulosum]